jgi:hypothetical protein
VGGDLTGTGGGPIIRARWLTSGVA